MLPKLGIMGRSHRNGRGACRQGEIIDRAFFLGELIGSLKVPEGLDALDGHSGQVQAIAAMGLAMAATRSETEQRECFLLQLPGQFAAAKAELRQRAEVAHQGRPIEDLEHMSIKRGNFMHSRALPEIRGLSVNSDIFYFLHVGARRLEYGTIFIPIRNEMDRHEELRLFIRATELGSFSRVAQERGIRQSTVSKVIARLEDRWTTTLFQRTTRRVTLTEAGGLALERARAAIDTLDELDRLVGETDREPVGLLRIHASVAFARYVLARLVADFVRAYPRLQVDFVTADRPIDLVEEAVDLAFVTGPFKDGGHSSRLVGHFERVVVAAPEFLAHAGDVKGPDRLAGLPCIISTYEQSAERWRLFNGQDVTDVVVSGPVKASSGGIAHELALSGLGIALVPEYLVSRDLRTGELVRILPGWKGDPDEARAIWTSGRRLSYKAEALISFIAERLLER
jgi:DNA-binding transcriptional LysR family regulator